MNALIKSTVLGGLVIVGLAIGPFEASATSASVKATGKYSSNEGSTLQDIEKFAYRANRQELRFPDEMLVLRKPDGEMSGVVWVYREAVREKDGDLADARFALINGKLEYVALSKSN